LLSVDWGEVGGICAVVALLFSAGAYGGKLMNTVMKARNKPKEQQKADTAEIHTQLNKIEKSINTVVEVLAGRDPSPMEPSPPPGLVAVVNDHSRLLAKLVPNGGGTNDPGDLQLRMAERMGVVLDEPDIEEPH